jgi:hypothetical protein
MLAYADVCWRLLAYADVCWRMLQELRRALESEEWTSAAAAAEAHKAAAAAELSPTASEALSVPANKVLQQLQPRPSRQAPHVC